MNPMLLGNESADAYRELRNGVLLRVVLCPDGLYRANRKACKRLRLIPRNKKNKKGRGK